MKQFFCIVIILFFSLTCFATDLLIVGKDTFYLKTYPLEALHLKQRPFGLDKQEVQISNKYPGYEAVWSIVDGKLYLEKILSSVGDSLKEENIGLLFKKNALSFQVRGNAIFAEWFSIAYYPIEPFAPQAGRLYLMGSYDTTINSENVLVRIEKGHVIINKLLKDYR